MADLFSTPDADRPRCTALEFIRERLGLNLPFPGSYPAEGQASGKPGLKLKLKIMDPDHGEGTLTLQMDPDLHRFLGGLSVLFTAVHVAALIADNYVAFGPVDVLVPLAASWKPEPVAWGVVSMYLLAAVEGTSLVMKRMPRHWWRAVHLSSYALFWMAVIHGARAGTDAGHAAYVQGSMAAVLLVAFLTAYRVAAVRKSRRGRIRARSVPASGAAALPREPGIVESTIGGA